MDQILNQTAPQPAPDIAGAKSNLIVKGQGVVAVRATISDDDGAELRLQLSTNDPAKPILYLTLTPKSYKLVFGSPAFVGGNIPLLETVIPAKELKGPAACYLVPSNTVTYWLSIDRDNGILRYGKDYLNVKLTLLKADLKEQNDGLMVWIDKKYDWLSDLQHVEVLKGGKDQVSLIPHFFGL